MAHERILVVDDNPTNLKLLRVVLVAEGYQVDTAVDANEAMTLLDRCPTLMLLDLQLPGMDGFELAKRVKTEPKTGDIIIIAVTAYAMPGDEAKARAAGCDGYVTKPVDTRALPELVAHYLSRPQEVGV